MAREVWASGEYEDLYKKINEVKDLILFLKEYHEDELDGMEKKQLDKALLSLDEVLYVNETYGIVDYTTGKRIHK